MKILVLGSNGYIGQSLVHALRLKGHIVTGLDISESNYAGTDLYRSVDLSAKTNWKHVKDWQEVNDLTINLAGLVGYKKCDENPDLATIINAEFPSVLTEGKTIQISAADSIYGIQEGNGTFCITEHDKPNPQSHYGKTKLEGENAILSSDNSRVLRLSSVFGVSPLMRWDVLIHDWIYTLLLQNSLEVFDPYVVRSFAYLPCVIEAIIDYTIKFEEKPPVQNICNYYGKKIDIARTLGLLFDNSEITLGEGKDPEGRNYIIDSAHDKTLSPYQGSIQWHVETRKGEYEYPYNISNALATIANKIKSRAIIEFNVHNNDKTKMDISNLRNI